MDEIIAGRGGRELEIPNQTDIIVHQYLRYLDSQLIPTNSMDLIHWVKTIRRPKM